MFLKIARAAFLPHVNGNARVHYLSVFVKRLRTSHWENQTTKK